VIEISSYISCLHKFLPYFFSPSFHLQQTPDPSSTPPAWKTFMRLITRKASEAHSCLSLL
jgi:hypothetical protein